MLANAAAAIAYQHPFVAQYRSPAHKIKIVIHGYAGTRDMDLAMGSLEDATAPVGYASAKLHGSQYALTTSSRSGSRS